MPYLFQPRPASQSWLARLLTESPGAAAIMFAVLHFLALSITTLMTQSTLNLDVLEQVAWSRDPQWAYSKHPPLPAWITAAAMWVSGDDPWAAALLGPLASAIALVLIWIFARQIMPPRAALMALFLSEGVIYFNFASIEFNHNVILLPLWALIAFFAHRAYRSGKLSDWALLGIAAALGVLGKYATALLLPAVLIAFAADSDGRKRLQTYGPAVAILCSIVILAPHLWGLYQVDFAPFQYATERMHSATSLVDRLTFPAGWFAAQILNTAPAICLSLALLFLFRTRLPSQSSPMLQFENQGARQDLQFVAILFAAPILLALAIQTFGGVRFRDMWGFPFFVLFGPVIALLTAARPSNRNVLPKLAVASTAMLALAVTALIAVNVGSPYLIKERGPRSLFPAQELASEVGSQWASLFGAKPLRYVITDAWLGGMFAAYHADHPSVLLSGDFKQSPWVKPEVIGEEGGILVWNKERDGEKLMRAFPRAIRQPPLQLAFHTKAAIPAARVDWAILPPSNAEPALASRSALSAFH